MSQLTIKNVGPINEVSFRVNKVNIFIGPQSSGKSTIAKIISFCKWLEKDIVAHQNAKYINTVFLEKELLDFHKIRSYFKSDSYIYYVSHNIEFIFKSSNDFSIHLLEHFKDSKVGKVAYVPSERNIISLPNITGFKFEDDYIRSFVFDWLLIRRKFDKDNILSLQELGATYHFDEDSEKDVILLNNGKPISIEEASSGMQSFIPLFAYINYVSKWIYEHTDDISYDNNKVIREGVLRKMSNEDENTADFYKMIDNESVAKALNQMISTVIKFEKGLDENKLDDKIKKMVSAVDGLCKPHFTDLIVEEPELNLFPDTQINLIYNIFRLINKERDSITITTHSQYILYALNNLIMAYTVKDKMPEDEYKKLDLCGSELKSENVSIYEIYEGHFRDNSSIQNSDGLVEANYFDKSMKRIMDTYYQMIEYYE